MTELSNIENISPEVPRTPEIVGAEVRNLTTQAKNMSVYFAVEIGRRLVEAKDIVPHGDWLDWLKKETEFSQPTASRFMRIFNEYGADQQSLFGAVTKYSSLNNLSVSNALKLLAVPEDEREEFAAEVDAEHLSARELEAAIKEREKELAALKAEMAETSEMLDKTLDEKAALASVAKEYRDNAEAAEKKLEELRSRPVEVAVAEPDPAEIERRAAELAEEAKDTALKQADAKIKAIEADAKTEKAKLEDKLKALEKSASEDRAELVQKIREAEAKLAEAQDKPEDSTREEELAALKKQLAMSGAELVTFKLRFGAWQEAYAAMRSALEAVPAEQRSNCEAAIRAVIEGWSENA